MFDLLAKMWIAHRIIRGDTLEDIRKRWPVRLGLWLIGGSNVES